MTEMARSTSSDSVGFAIIGSGFMGRTYAETVSQCVEGAHVVGIAGGSRAGCLAADYKVTHFASCDEVFEQDEVDAVMIATPHAIHAEHAVAAATAGKHLLIDKPMACTVEECDAILGACKAKNLKCSITFTHRTRLGNVKAKELIGSGKLGRVLHIRSFQVVPGGMEIVPKWQLESENIGLLFGHGIHNLDGLRWFTGQEIKTVWAKCRNLASGFPVEGTSDVLATLADGTVGYIFCSFEVPKPSFPRSQLGLRIICEKGLVDIDAYGQTRASIDGGDWETIATQAPIDWAGKGALDPVRLQAYRAIIQDLVDSIHEDRCPTITGWDGRQAVAAALAAYQSSRTGKEVSLDT